MDGFMVARNHEAIHLPFYSFLSSEDFLAVLYQSYHIWLFEFLSFGEIAPLQSPQRIEACVFIKLTYAI